MVPHFSMLEETSTAHVMEERKRGRLGQTGRVIPVAKAFQLRPPVTVFRIVP